MGPNLRTCENAAFQGLRDSAFGVQLRILRWEMVRKKEAGRSETEDATMETEAREGANVTLLALKTKGDQ